MPGSLPTRDDDDDGSAIASSRRRSNARKARCRCSLRFLGPFEAKTSEDAGEGAAAAAREIDEVTTGGGLRLTLCAAALAMSVDWSGRMGAMEEDGRAGTGLTASALLACSRRWKDGSLNGFSANGLTEVPACACPIDSR